MEVYGKSMVSVPTKVIYLSSILGQDGPHSVHKCDWKCENEHVCGNIYRCRLTGFTHICDKNCNQRILYDNHSSLCRVSRQVFPLTLAEEQAVKGARRKLDAESSPSDICTFKRRRSAQFHPSPFERSFSAVGPICSQIGDGMDIFGSPCFAMQTWDSPYDAEEWENCSSCIFFSLLHKNSEPQAEDEFYKKTRSMLISLGLQNYEKDFNALRDVRIPPGPRPLVLDCRKRSDI